MKKLSLYHVSTIVIILLLATACSNAAQTPPPPTVDVAQVQTKAAQDVIASQTAAALTLTPKPTNTPIPTKAPVPCAKEDFTSPDWVVVNNKGTAIFTPSNGMIEIEAVGGEQDLYAGSSMDAPRLIKKIPAEDFEMLGRVTIPVDPAKLGGFQASGLVLYFNTLNYAWVALSAYGNVEAVYTLRGERKNFFPEAMNVGIDTLYLGFKGEGLSLAAGYSTDGIHYTWSEPVVFDTSNLRAGVTVLSAWDAPGFSGVFECFEVKKSTE